MSGVGKAKKTQRTARLLGVRSRQMASPIFDLACIFTHEV